MALCDHFFWFDPDWISEEWETINDYLICSFVRLTVIDVVLNPRLFSTITLSLKSQLNIFECEIVNGTNKTRCGWMITDAPLELWVHTKTFHWSWNKHWKYSLAYYKGQNWKRRHTGKKRGLFERKRPFWNSEPLSCGWRVRK